MLSGNAAPYHPIPHALTVTKRAVGKGVVPADLKRVGQHHDHPTSRVFRVPAPRAKVKANFPCRWQVTTRSTKRMAL
ncbi:hypothetical protein E2I00_002207 [Balaenoptera physalus]|uniref:Uncharacterized protein n=1 Tax=Balaenoptera physalus TaxID=9770 RepID=A0A6A1Q228_BALPH|nr:hypothetical protein E2I00_002207 [Balaenoptera physalus]